MKAAPWFARWSVQRSVDLGAFLVPGLALWLRSGYSWGAVWLLVCALALWPRWRRAPLAGSTRALLAVICAMALIFSAEAGLHAGWSGQDRPLKYLMSLPCLLLLAWRGPRVQALWAGLAAGAWGAGALALWQTLGQGVARAAGYTNAIQFGNLALLLGLLCLAGLIALWPHWRGWQRAALAGGVFMGWLASVLSQTRGGWLALLLLLPALAAMLLGRVSARTLRIGASACAALTLGLALAYQQPLLQRLEKADHETRSFLTHQRADTSVGHRFAHWQLAWELGLQKPLWGWGRAGYEQEKRQRIEQGRAPLSVQFFDHAHNEALDIFMRRGLIGVLALLAFYAVPLWRFWPTEARLARAPPGQRAAALALRLAGALLPLAYIGFGLTQVFFSHNSGNLFYLFMLALLHGSLLAQERPLPPATTLPKAKLSTD